MLDSLAKAIYTVNKDKAAYIAYINTPEGKRWVCHNFKLNKTKSNVIKMISTKERPWRHTTLKYEYKDLNFVKIRNAK